MPWSSGLFGIFAEPTGPVLCAYSCFCGCCAAGDVALEAGGNYFASCCLGYCCPCLGLLMRCDTRHKLATKYSIALPTENEALITCATLCCCGPCALRQELSQIAKEKSIGSDKLFGAEDGVAARKPPADDVGKSIAYAISGSMDVINRVSGKAAAPEATTGLSK